MSRHEGVSCDNCLKSNFRDKRFKCLICYDYDLCEQCHNRNVSTSRHSPFHPMQCILTRNDFDLYYGGEGITMDNPPAVTCPLCGKHGLTESTLQEHWNAHHLDNNAEVVCPICAAVPTGDPNHVTDEFATHLMIEHNNTPDQIGGRHMRRMFYPGRGMRGARAQRSANMNFSSGPSTVPAFSNVVGSTTSSVSQMRDAMDPIAELLSQLSGVRRNAQQLQQTVSTASQLQELQAQLQLERQRATIIRQQLERFPGKLQTTQNGQESANQANAQNKSYANAMKAAVKKDKEPSSVTNDNDSRLLLSKIYEQNSSDGSEIHNIDTVEQSLFVRELILALPNDEEPRPDNMSPISQPSSTSARAIPVDCGILSSTPLQLYAGGGGPGKVLHASHTSLASASEVCQSPERSDLANQFHDTGLGRSVVSESDIPTQSSNTLRGARKSESEEKMPLLQSGLVSEMKKDSAARGVNLQQQPFSSAGAGLLCPQATHVVPIHVSNYGQWCD